LNNEELRAGARERYQPIIVGRTRELAELWELASKGRHVLVSGAPGIGKSVLLEMLLEGLSERGDLNVFRVSEVRPFKNALVELAEQLHEKRIFLHPRLSVAVARALPWEKLAPKVRALTVKVLAETLVLSLKGRQAILICDQFDRATPTELAWFHQFFDVATVILATPDPTSSKLKPVLDRVPAKVELKEFSQAESEELIDRCFDAAPFAVSDIAWYRREIWRKSQGNPRAIKDLLADHSLEKYIDSQAIRAMASEQGVRYFAVSWVVLAGALLFSIHRYVGRGLGDRDAYIIGAVGMVVFIFLSMLVRKANRRS